MPYHVPTGQVVSNAQAPAAIKADTSTKSMVAPYDPRLRSSTSTFANIEAAPPLSTTYQTALSSYSGNAMTPLNMPTPAVVPLTLDYNTPQIVYPQVQQKQSPNMFLYGCLQRSPWYQSLMSTMKIQINQTISQLVRALNNFHRERLLNPSIVFDVFKIDCAGEILEIMRNLDIIIDSNGLINEQRQMSSFAGRSCCNNTPVNATYSFIQQVLTPNTHRTSMTTTSSTYNSSDSGTMGPLNMTEPFVSCYIKSPHNNNDNNPNCVCKTEHHNNNGRSCNQNEKRYNQFKKPLDSNNYNNDYKGSNRNNNYQQRSNQRSYNNNPRFVKPSDFSNRSASSSPPNSPKDSTDYDNSNNYNGGGFGSGRGKGGRFNNNSNNKRRFNGGSAWSSTHSSDNDNRFNDKYQKNQSTYNSSNSPTRSSSPPTSSYQQRSESPTVSPKRVSPAKPNINDDEEECWD